jgi:serine/threonine protein kinase
LIDLGQAREWQPGRMTLKTVGTTRYRAPEVMFEPQYDFKVDIYSFALVLYFMQARVEPFDGMSEVEIVKAVVERDERPALGDDWSLTLRTLIERCWHRDPRHRPSSSDLLLQLHEWRRQV